MIHSFTLMTHKNTSGYLEAESGYKCKNVMKGKQKINQSTNPQQAIELYLHKVLKKTAKSYTGGPQ